MEFVKLILLPDASHFCKNTSNDEMMILGHFLTSNVGYRPSFFKNWGINDNGNNTVNGNTVSLEKKGDYIFLSDMYSEGQIPTVLSMT
jgi:hypothetical protein